MLVWSLMGLLVGLAVMSCGAYLALRRPDRLKRDMFAKRLGLDRAPRSYWMQCVAAGAFFVSCGLMALLSASGEPEREFAGWEAAAMLSLLSVAGVAVVAVIILQARASKEQSGDDEGEA